MKLSNYNHIVKIDENKYALFNCLNGALLTMTKDEYYKMNTITSSAEPGKVPMQNAEYYKVLKNNGYLIDDNYDEYEIVMHKYCLEAYNKQKLKIYIVPTLECNFSCTYCYQIANKKVGGKNVVCYNMSGDELMDIYMYLKKITLYMEELTIVWYGGEPLLRIDDIVMFSKHIKRDCDDNECNLNLGIITNGYLLNKDNVKKLYEAGIKSIYITIDGDRDIHNSRRYLKDHQGTFDVILNNVIGAMPFFNIRIRTNIDKDNLNSIDAMFDEFKKRNLSNKIRWSLHYTTTCTYQDSNLIQIEDVKAFDKIRTYLIRANEMGLIAKKNAVFNKLCTGCEANKLNNIVIAPGRKVYKCQALLGKENADGYLLKGGAIRTSTSWANWMQSLYKSEECKRCSFLPICMGGCQVYERTNLRPREYTQCKQHSKLLLENEVKSYVIDNE